MKEEEKNPPRLTKRQLFWRWLNTPGWWDDGDPMYEKAMRHSIKQWQRAGVVEFFEGNAYSYPDITGILGPIPESTEKMVYARASFVRSAGQIRWTVKLNRRYEFKSVAGLSGFKLWLHKYFSQKLSLETVLMHEIGHTLGLPDNDIVGSIMHGYIVSRSTSILTEQDLNLLRNLYK